MSLAPEVSVDRLMSIMQGMGYDCVVNDDKSFRARHPSRMNLAVKLIAEKGLVLFLHYWKTKKGWRGVPMDRVNQANRVCLVNTVSIDSDGDISGSFYLPATSGFHEDELRHVLELADEEFKVAAVMKLAEFMG